MTKGRRGKASIYQKSVVLLLSAAFLGCETFGWRDSYADGATDRCLTGAEVVVLEQAELFHEAETERTELLKLEISRLQMDLKTAESALVEAESGLAGSHTRAEAVSSIATTRIQVERAEAKGPWHVAEIEEARAKLEEAVRQVEETRFGAALFFAYRAQRLAESILAEAELIASNSNVRIIQPARVNLRSGPSTDDSVLSVLTGGTPVFPQARDGHWVFVQVRRGPAGWIHRRLMGESRPE